jgi:hypothetical protein
VLHSGNFRAPRQLRFDMHNFGITFQCHGTFWGEVPYATRRDELGA